MHSLETINKLNNQAQESWLEKQASPDNKTQKRTEGYEQSFLMFSINQALSLSGSHKEVATRLTPDTAGGYVV